MIKPLVYSASSGTPVELPFDRFLPLDPPGMVSRWLQREAASGSTILDPLGASPGAVLEAAAAGYRLLVACNNPVIAFELRLLASAPKAAEFTSVIRELGDQKKGDEQLETSILNLYLTRCASCGAEIQASGYLYNRGEPLPHARFYTCPRCGDAGEHTITDEDIQRLQQVQHSEPLHRSRALARVLGGSVEDRETAEAAINIYPVRALQVLFTLINKMEGMHLTEYRRELLEALLLSLLDAGNAIWSWPGERERPRQLSIPTQYVEKNLWLEIDHAIETWSSNTAKVEFTTWPQLLAGNGICLYPGRMRDLAQAAASVKIDRVLCVFPRPNQAFWTLCSLWASWLWGHERAGGFSQVMERRRFDWYWHTTALHAALLPAASLAGESVPVLGILPEPAAGLVSAVIESASISGLDITGCAFKNDVEPLQVEWKTGARNREFKPVNIQKTAREAIRDLLNEIAEPTEYLVLHTAMMCALAEENAFPLSIQQMTNEKAIEIQSMLTKLLSDDKFLRRMDATAQDPESGLWWLVKPDPKRTPLADRLELELLTWLQTEIRIPVESLPERIHQRFPGYLTPPDDLVRQCLQSYAVQDASSQAWLLKEHETPQARETNMAEMRELVSKLAVVLQMRQEGDYPITWYVGTSQTSPVYKIYLSATAVIEREALGEGCDTIFLLPGSRAGLLKFKIERDPYLRERLTPNFHYLKYRTLRSIATRADLSPEVWQVLIDSDPLSLEETTQLSIFR